MKMRTPSTGHDSPVPPFPMSLLRKCIDSREALADRDALISIVAHDMKGPLAALLLIVQSILRSPEPPLAPDLRRKLEHAQVHVRHLVLLVEHLLDPSAMLASSERLVRSGERASRPQTVAREEENERAAGCIASGATVGVACQ